MSTQLTAGIVTQLAPGVRRIVAPNPGMMTGPGTNTYLLGESAIAVIDPGPYADTHVEAIIAACGDRIRWILATHTHRDHSPAAQALNERTGAPRIGMLPPDGPRQDGGFEPETIMRDGDSLSTDEFTLRAVHTPGHAPNHLCFLHEQLGWLFTGDHVMNGSTVVIDPPDGNMNAYLQSLRNVRSLPVRKLAPGHGDLLHDPVAEIDFIIEHRLDRQARLIAALSTAHEKTEEELVVEVYDEIDQHRHPIAMRSLLAHLIKLEEDGKARDTGSGWILED